MQTTRVGCEEITWNCPGLFGNVLYGKLTCTQNTNCLFLDARLAMKLSEEIPSLFSILYQSVPPIENIKAGYLDIERDSIEHVQQGNNGSLIVVLKPNGLKPPWRFTALRIVRGTDVDLAEADKVMCREVEEWSGVHRKTCNKNTANDNKSGHLCFEYASRSFSIYIGVDYRS